MSCCAGAAAAAGFPPGRADSQPPTSEPDPGLLDLEREISALRPRPCEPHTELYRENTPHAFDRPGSDSPPPPPTVARASDKRDHGSGLVPRAPHEHLTPPPPPGRRGPDAKQFEADDELPTRAKNSLPPPGFLNQARSSILPSPPGPRSASTPPPRLSDRPPAGVQRSAGLPSSLPPPPAPGFLASPLPALPLPPPLPSDVSPVYQASGFGEQEWTDAKYAVPTAPLNATPALHPGVPTPAAVASRIQPAESPDSVRPLTTSIGPTAQSRWAAAQSWWALPAGWLPVAGAGVMGATLTAMAFSLPQKGQLLVDVSSQHWTQVAGVQIYLNDKLVCSQSPCAIKVDADSEYRVRAEAPGYQASTEQTVAVADDSVALHKIQLGASADTGIDVTTTIPNLQLYIDGRRVGSLPRKVMGLTPGEHTILVSGGPYFSSAERRITVEPNQLLAISDLEPTLVAGGLELTKGDHSEGATVLLDGQPISLPYSGKLEAGKTYQLMATRDGYRPFERTIEFSAEQPVIKWPVSLTPDSKDNADEETADSSGSSASSDSSSRDRLSSTRQARSSRSNSRHERTVSSTKASEKTPAPSSSGPVSDKASINIVTTPSALVLLNGKPIGRTPKQVRVSPGKHSIVLMHNDERKRATITLEPGANKTVKASF